MKTTSDMSKTEFKLLGFFFDNPTKKLYEAEVKEKTALSAGSVNKYLDLLAKRGHLILERKGKMKFFKLNRENQIIKKLKISYNLSKPLAEKLRKLEYDLGVKLYIYGSVARGEDIEDSDWDVLVIGQVKPSELRNKNSNKKLKFNIFTKREWLEMKKKDPAFYERVEKDKTEI